MVFSRSDALSTSRLARPSRLEQRKIWCRRGLRQSQSINSTRLPLLASSRPSEATITDLPSAGVAELIRMVLGELAVSDSSTPICRRRSASLYDEVGWRTTCTGGI